jgi:hypothetical protein
MIVGLDAPGAVYVVLSDSANTVVNSAPSRGIVLSCSQISFAYMIFEDRSGSLFICRREDVFVTRNTVRLYVLTKASTCAAVTDCDDIYLYGAEKIFIYCSIAPFIHAQFELIIQIREYCIELKRK